MSVFENASNIPNELKALPYWLCWKYVQRPNKPKLDKVPFYVNGDVREGTQGTDSDRAQLATFDDALRVAQVNGFTGVGLAMLPDLGLIALDFDNICTDPLPEWIADAVAGTYAEVSPSGRGIRAFYWGALTGRKQKGCEVFSSTGYVTVTGNALPDRELFGWTTVAPLSEAARALYAERFGDSRPADRDSGEDPFAWAINPAEVTGDTIADLASALAFLAAQGFGDSYDQWHPMGQAVKSLERAGRGAEGLALWIDYSRACKGFNEAEARRKWERDLRGERSHFGAVFKQAQALGWINPRSLAGRIAAADDDDLEQSDVLLARRLARDILAGRMLFDHSAKQWREWRAGAWHLCGLGEAKEAAKKLGPLLLREASEQPDKSEWLMALAKRAMGAAGLNAALGLAESDPMLAVSGSSFDRDPDLLNVRNGVVHLPTGELRPHDPALMLARQCSVNFDSTLPCPRWLKFLDDISVSDPDWVDYLHRFLGYCLSGHVREEVLAFWFGGGANGKSVAANILRCILGDYCTTVPIGFLMVASRDGEAATPALASLPGVRIALANEVESGARLSAQAVKNAVSTEAIHARQLYGKSFTFVPSHKVIVRGNHKPIVFDADEGIWRRLRLTPFDARFDEGRRDPHLEGKLMAEAPGILAWMVAGFGEYLRRGLKPARRVAAASAAYRAESDLIGQWIAERAKVAAGADCVQREAYADYQAWCSEQGLRPIAKKSLSAALEERGYHAGQRSGGARERTYRGFSLTVAWAT